MLISILICTKYFHMIYIIRARNVQAECNIKPKPWSHISGPGFGFLVLALRT